MKSGAKKSSMPASPLPPATAADAAAASFKALTVKLDYLDSADIKRVRDAYRFADEAHLGQCRASGEPYITHPIAVAGLCAEWKLDAQAIMAALMHDAMEDCGVSKAELIERFGVPVAELVDGLTKLDKLRFSTREESQAESFRKMLLAMARDVRVILVKLADRLHNMRRWTPSIATSAPASPPRRSTSTRRSRNRLGLNQTTASCRSCRSGTCCRGASRALEGVQKARGFRRDAVARIQTEARSLRQGEAQGRISGREKTLYSIYAKMRDNSTCRSRRSATSLASASSSKGARVLYAPRRPAQRHEAVPAASRTTSRFPRRTATVAAHDVVSRSAPQSSYRSARS